MKKAVSMILAATIICTLALGLTGCGTNEKKQEAIEKHTAIAISFNEVATMVNENADILDGTVISTYNQMAELLNRYTEILQGDQDIPDEKYDEMIAWFDDVEYWIEDTKAEIEVMISEAEQ